MIKKEFIMYSVKKISVIVFFLLGTTGVLSQPLSVIAGVNQDNKVTVKWFSNEQFNIDGVNIYRKEKDKSDWVKLNDAPFKRMNKLEDKNASDEMKFYNALINLEPDAEQKENWNLMQITKGVLDPKFAVLFGMQYDDADVQAGKTYEYKVVRLRGTSETEGQVSNPVNMDKYKSPNAPEGFTSSQGHLESELKWAHDKRKFFAYNVYRSSSEKGEYKLVNDVPVVIFTFTDENGKPKEAASYYTDTTLTEGQTYYYQLTGLNFFGHESERSKTVKFTAVSLMLPPAATNLRYTNVGNKVSLFWKVESNPGLKEVNIYRALKINGNYEKVNKKALTGKDTAFSDLIENPEPAYYYYVESVGKNEKTAKSQILFVNLPDITPPSKPIGLKGTADPDRIMLSWDMGTDRNLLGYIIYKSTTGNEDDFLLLTPHPVQKNEYIDTVDKKTQNYYYYRIYAVSKTYFNSEPSAAIKVRVKDIVAPTAPYITRGYYENGLVTLEWYSSFDEDLLGYDLFRSKYPDTLNIVQVNKKVILPQVTSYKDSITNEGTYRYMIISSDTNKNKSEFSLPMDVDVVTPDTSKEFIVNLKAVSDTVNKKISLTWDKVKKSSLSGYLVFRNEDGVPTVISEIIKENTFEDKSPNPGVNIYKVKAYFENGEVSESTDIEISY